LPFFKKTLPSVFLQLSQSETQIVCGGYFRDSSFLVNKRVLAEEEQTVATLLEKSANLEEPEQREVDFSLS